MIGNAYGYECYINDQLVQKKVHTLHPLINAVATQDKNKIYLKIVNVSGKEEEISISADCAVGETILTEVLAADPREVNSFEDKEHVSSVYSARPFGECACHREKRYRRIGAGTGTCGG